jgi:two-component system phosphate regulon sensor histidine kinase PhoR
MPRLSMFWQIFLAFGVLIVISLGALGGVVGAWVEQRALQEVEEHLKSKAILLQEIVRGRSVADLRSQVMALREKTETRITLIAPAGKALVESERDPDELDDHSTRPEIEAARHASFGTAIRFSTSMNKTMMYVAVAVPSSDSSELGFVRVASPVTDAQAHATQLRHLVWASAGLTALVALVLAWWLARRFVQPLHELSAGARQIAAGEFGHKVYLDRKDDLGDLADAFNHMSAQLADQFTQLDEDRQQLRAVLGSMVEGVIAIDDEQNILFANERAGQMLEFAPRNAAGRKLWEVVRQRAVQDMVQATMRATGGEPNKLEFADPDGKSLLMHVAQLPGETARGAVLVFHDTTELRRLERLRQDFVANVSHELKTPLSVITACIETLLEGGIEDLEHRGRFLERIQEQSQRLHTLILDLLSLARIESGEHLLTIEALAVADLAAACVERHQARAQSKKQTLLLEPPTQGDIRVLADDEAMSEILDNLVDNALKYTPEGGTIRLRWWGDDGHCNIEVQDTGIGIPEADLPRVFERFYRVDKARSRELGGTGLGLAIVKHLVQALQGAIRADSVLGQGSTFKIRLPKPE